MLNKEYWRFNFVYMYVPLSPWSSDFGSWSSAVKEREEGGGIAAESVVYFTECVKRYTLRCRSLRDLHYIPRAAGLKWCKKWIETKHATTRFDCQLLQDNEHGEEIAS